MWHDLINFNNSSYIIQNGNTTVNKKHITQLDNKMSSISAYVLAEKTTSPVLL